MRNNLTRKDPKEFSNFLIVILSLVLNSCIPGDTLAGAGGADGAYPPPAATEAPLEKELPTSVPPTDTIAAPTDIPSEDSTGSDVATQTPPPLSTLTPTPSATEAELNPEIISTDTLTATNTATNTATMISTPTVTATATSTPTNSFNNQGAAAAPNITVTSTCDGAGNSIFTISNTAGAMTGNYTWELYQNGVFLTSGTFLLAASSTQQLSINGLYGNLSVAIKNGTTPAAIQIASSAAFCVTPTPTKTRTPTATKIPPNITVSSTCDGAGNSIFTISNTGGAMTGNYTWELYQNGVFLTSGVFLLAASSNTQLSINGLYGNLSVAIKNGTTPAAIQIASSAALCVTPTPTRTRTTTITRTPTKTRTPTITFTASKTPTHTITPTASRTLTATITNTRTITSTSTSTATGTSTATITETPSITPTPTITDTPTITPTASLTPTASNTPTETLTPTITNTSTITPTPSNTATATHTLTATITATITQTPSTTSTITSTSTASLTPTVTRTRTSQPTKTSQPVVTIKSSTPIANAITSTTIPSSTVTNASDGFAVITSIVTGTSTSTLEATTSPTSSSNVVHPTQTFVITIVYGNGASNSPLWCLAGMILVMTIAVIGLIGNRRRKRLDP